MFRLRKSALVLAAAFLLSGAAASLEGSPSCYAKACILMAEDGTVLFEKNVDERLPMASTTKLMTALVCLETCAPDETVRIKASHCLVEGSSMYLKADVRYTVRDLLYGLLLASGNDAALALADHVSGSAEGFVRKMNQRAVELGLRNTHFANPHGLDSAGHFSSARDLARLMFACMERPDFRALTSAVSAAAAGETLLNHNKLLRTCPGCIGGKTGYTSKAGRCLVSCCEREGLRLVCVTLADPDDWNDHAVLYDWAFRRFARFDLEDRIDWSVPVISGSRTSVKLRSRKPMAMVLPRDAEILLRAELPRFVFAPVKAGGTAGILRVIVQGKVIAEAELLYAEGAVLAYPVSHFPEVPLWQSVCKS